MIGIFDSGIGGLTVVKELFEQLPEYQIVYFGDTARTPYGNKSKETIVKYAAENTQFLINKGAKVIVIACNSASAAASEGLQEKFDYPIFEVINPAVERALAVTKNKRIGVIGTRATVNSGIYEKLLKEKDPEVQVFSKPCPLLVPLVEEGWLNKPETKRIVKSCLHDLKAKQVDTLILGCTHYPLLKDVISVKIGKRVNLVDSAEEIVKKIKEFLDNNPEVEKVLTKNQDHKFFVSDLTPHFFEIAKRWLGRDIKLEKEQVG